MVRHLQKLILVIATVISYVLPAYSAKIQLETIEAPDGKIANVIRISGEFVESDFVNFQRMINAQSEISAVLFDSSPGGRLYPGLEIGRLIRSKNLPTIATGFCYSACGLAWMGGTVLIAIGEDAPGFHAAFVGEGEVSAPGNAIVGAYLFELGYSNNIIEFATTAKPDSISHLDLRTARLMGLGASFVGNLQEAILFVPHFSPPKVSVPVSPVIPTFPVPIKPPRIPSETSDIDTDDQINDVEYRLWRTAASNRDKKLLETYLTLYPDGRFTEEAKLLLTSLNEDNQIAEERWYFAGFKGLDFWGGDLSSKGIEADTVATCAEICAANINCKLFTYNERAKSCFPKSSIDMTVKDKNAISGLVYSAITKKGEKPPPPVVRAEFMAQSGVSFTGIQLPFWQPSKPIRDINACVRYCRDNDSCSYATFDRSRSGQRCTIWRYRISGTKTSRRAVSFTKIDEVIEPTTEIIELGVVQ